MPTLPRILPQFKKRTEAPDGFFHPNFEHLRKICTAGFFDARAYDFARVRDAVPMPALLNYVGLPLSKNQPCLWHANSQSGLSIFRHRDDEHWVFYCNECNLGGDVTEFWHQLILSSGLGPRNWSRSWAAGDLLARAQAGEIDVTIDELVQARSGRARHPARAHPDEHREKLKELKKELAGTRKAPSPREKAKLPRPVPISVREAIEGMFPTNGFLMIARKPNGHDIMMRDWWLGHYRDARVPERSWMSSSYLSRDDANCSYAGFEGSTRRWLIVESDSGYSLESQLWVLKRLGREFGGLGCVCFSGNKSLHGFFLVDKWPAEERFELYARALELIDIDINLWRITQPCRLPGGWNHKTGKKQTILLWNL